MFKITLSSLFKPNFSGYKFTVHRDGTSVLKTYDETVEYRNEVFWDMNMDEYLKDIYNVTVDKQMKQKYHMKHHKEFGFKYWLFKTNQDAQNFINDVLMPIETYNIMAGNYIYEEDDI